MSKRLPPMCSAQASFDQFQLLTPQPDRQPRLLPQNKRQQALAECIPKSENEWQRARKRHRLVTPDDINAWVSNLVLLDRTLPEGLYRLINAAIFCVESREDEDAAHRDYEARASSKCMVRSIRNYVSLVRGLVALMDQIYLRLRHRAFEAVLLYGK